MPSQIAKRIEQGLTVGVEAVPGREGVREVGVDLGEVDEQVFDAAGKVVEDDETFLEPWYASDEENPVQVQLHEVAENSFLDSNPVHR